MMGLLLVSVRDGDRPGRIFGVEVKASADIQTLVTEEGAVRVDVAKKIVRQLSEYPFPVGMMLFDIRNDEGYFGWALAPDIGLEDGRTALRVVTPLQVESLTNDLLRRLLQEVNDWYEARKPAIA